MNVAVDLVALAVHRNELNTLAVHRSRHPFTGHHALPGGLVNDDEDLPDAAGRHLLEQTGIRPADGHLEQFGIYATPGRDPRGRVVSIAYLALLPGLPTPVADTGTTTVDWRPVRAARRLAFDHDQILFDGLEHLRTRLEHTTLATTLCPPEFTISELRVVYEAVWATTLDPRNFSRKALSTPDLLRPTGSCWIGPTGGAPAGLYTRGNAKVLYPPLRRPDGSAPDAGAHAPIAEESTR